MEREETRNGKRFTAVYTWWLWLGLAAIAGLGVVAARLAAGSGPVTLPWSQQYAPVGNSIFLSSLCAALPIVTIFLLMAGLRLPAHTSALAGLGLTLLLATQVWQMPGRLAASSVLLGAATAVFPILWTLANAVWIFNMLVASGYFEVLKQSLAAVTCDRRLQTVLIGFGFTTLLESIAAFGAPIAVVAAMLVGIGFPPVLAAVVTLLADTTIASWGTQGMPVVVLHSVTGLDITALAAVIGRQTPVASALFPIALVLLVSGWRGFKEVWGVTLLAGLAYGAVAALVANFQGPYTVGIAASLASIATVLAVLRRWRPRRLWLFPTDAPPQNGNGNGCAPSLAAAVRAWSPYLLLVLVIGLVNSTPLKTWLAKVSTVTFAWPVLHNAVLKTAPVTAAPEAYPAVYSQPLLTVGGTLVFVAGVLTALALGLKPRRALSIYTRTLKQLCLPGLTIVCLLSTAYLMNYSAMTYTVGLAFGSTGFWFPMATAFLGMIGCTLAGSVAASNALFGNLAVVGGAQIGIDPVLAAGTLSSGGTMGKAVAFQDIVVAGVALQLNNKEGELLRRVFWPSIVFALLIGAVAMAQHHLW